MEGEVIVNGSHEPEIDTSEKILKPRKPKNTFKEPSSVIQNGNSETSSMSDITENGIENGHVEDTSKQNGNDSLLDEHEQEVKEGSMKKIRRKETTPKLENPAKRELRKRDSTPRASTPKNNSAPTPPIDVPNEKQFDKPKSEVKDAQDIDVVEDELKGGKIKSKEPLSPEESIVIVEETTEDKEELISINDSVDDKEFAESENRTSIFSIFSNSFKSNSSAEVKDAVEASTSSSSVVCLDSPSGASYSLPPKEIRKRKPINSFSKFPGRTVSIISLDGSIKRKADDSFDTTEKKRFAGDIENGTEKSPGWIFSSSWSPTRKIKVPQSSTPFKKRTEEDSMAVNYDENTNISLHDSDIRVNSDRETNKRWRCSVM